MKLRELAEDDLPALLGLCQRALPLDRFSLPVLRRLVLEEPDRNPAYQFCLWDGEQLVGVMLGGVRATDDGPAAWARLFAVEAAYRRRGLASQLLEELERRLRAGGLRRLNVANSIPAYFWPGLDVRYTPAFCFLQKHGFERYDDAVNMQVDLLARDWDTSAEEARLASAGFEVRRLHPSDRAPFSAWLQERWSPAWHAEALLSYQNDPISTFIATYRGRICAFASYDVAALEGGFGPTGTEPELRKLGLGRVLFCRCMADLKALGHQHAEVCWVGPIAFYARVADAWISRVFWSMGKSLEV